MYLGHRSISVVVFFIYSYVAKTGHALVPSRNHTASNPLTTGVDRTIVERYLGTESSEILDDQLVLYYSCIQN